MRAIVVHGGAGGSAHELAGRQQQACCEALGLGWEILVAGGSAVEAAVRAVAFLEDEPALNAGFGACLTAAGTIELDASIMEGTGRAAGAVAVLSRVRNPIVLARSLMEKGPHVFMVGAAAEELAAARGLALCDPDALISPQRRRSWARLPDAEETSAGTVGAVALDDRGRLAAATSTGGVPMKSPGRIGDSAVIGAGTFADDRAGAASATGHGEAIIRATLARTAVDHLRRGLDPERAAQLALAEVTLLGATAGIIIVDQFGRTAATYTTPHMTSSSRTG